MSVNRAGAPLLLIAMTLAAQEIFARMWGRLIACHCAGAGYQPVAEDQSMSLVAAPLLCGARSPVPMAPRPPTVMKIPPFVPQRFRNVGQDFILLADL